RSKPSRVDSSALEQTKAALAEAKRNLTEQTERANALALEKKALQSRLDNASAQAPSSAALDAVKKELSESNRKALQQNEANSKLQLENRTLQERLRTLGADTASLAALRAENELLKQQVATLQAAAPATASTPPAAASQAQTAVAHSDAELRRLERLALEERMK